PRTVPDRPDALRPIWSVAGYSGRVAAGLRTRDRDSDSTVHRVLDGCRHEHRHAFDDRPAPGAHRPADRAGEFGRAPGRSACRRRPARSSLDLRLADPSADRRAGGTRRLHGTDPQPDLARPAAVVTPVWGRSCTPWRAKSSPNRIRYTASEAHGHVE